MPSLSLGTIEVFGLPAAVEAADVACKTADVTLIGYETTDGMGMVAVKIEGQVSAVQAAVAAASAAAGSRHQGVRDVGHRPTQRSAGPGRHDRGDRRPREAQAGCGPPRRSRSHPSLRARRRAGARRRA
jgi:hypothetical protein